MNLSECANTLRAHAPAGNVSLSFHDNSAIFHKLSFHPVSSQNAVCVLETFQKPWHQTFSARSLLPNLKASDEDYWQFYWGPDWIVFLGTRLDDIQTQITPMTPQFLRFDTAPIDDPGFAMLIDFHRDHGQAFAPHERSPVFLGEDHAPSSHDKLRLHQTWSEKGLAAYDRQWRQAHSDIVWDPEERLEIWGVPKGSLLVSQSTDGVPLLQSLWILP